MANYKGSKGYDQSFKDQILVDMKTNGLSAHEAAKKHKVNVNSIYNWLKESKTDGVTLRQTLKELKEVKAQNEVLCALVKKFSLDSIKKK